MGRILKRLLPILGLLLCALPARAATPTVSQAAGNQTTTGTCAVTLTATTAGHLIVAWAYSDLSSSNTFSITDSSSQSYTIVPNTPFGVGNGRAEMWYFPNSASITSVTITDGVGTTVCYAYEIAGAALVTPFDGNASNAVVSSNVATGTSLASGTLTTNNANDILIYAVGEGTTSSGWTVGSGFSFNTGGSSTNRRGAMQSKGVSASGSQGTTTMSWTTTGVDRLGVFAAFADTNQSGVTCTPRLMLTHAGGPC